MSVGEYDGYTLPEAPKEVTPEMRAEFEEIMKGIKDMAKRLHQEAHERKERESKD